MLKGIWFLDTLVYVRVAEADGTDGLSVLEHRAPYGGSPPLHVHHSEDEVFCVLEGEFLFQLAGETRCCGPGTILLAPKGTPHTYRVTSAGGGRWLTVTARGDFERFVRTVGREAEKDALPSPAGPPSPEAAEALAATARGHHIDLVGPPLHERG